MYALQIVSSAIFYRIPGHEEAYITTINQYKDENRRNFSLWRRAAYCCRVAIILQLGLSFYADVFSELKALYPN
jgi:cyclic dehypoxanthinyl futalosine synthase